MKGGSNWPLPPPPSSPEKTTLKKPSLIRVKKCFGSICFKHVQKKMYSVKSYELLCTLCTFLRFFTTCFKHVCWDPNFLMIINELVSCFCGMVDQRKTFSLISSWDHYQLSSRLQISGTMRAGFESAQKLSSGFVEWSWSSDHLYSTAPHNSISSAF